MRLPTRPWPATVRGRRRLTVAALAVGAALLVSGQGAPYALVTPGPTPDLTAAVAAAQDTGHHADPRLGHGGRLLATTVDATQLTWWGAARCAASGCAMLPVDTQDPGAVAAARADMTASQAAAAAAAHALVGAATSYPSANLSADLGEVAGPSAGLMLTLAFVDALTPGDLTGGAVVAGTGTVTADGTVGPIAGIADKVAGAATARARVFFAPAGQAAQARAAAPAGLTVVGVRQAGDALRWLCGHGGASSVCAYYPPAP